MHRIFFGPPRFPYTKSQDIPGEGTRDGYIMLHPFVHQSRREKGPGNWIPMCLVLTSATLLHFTMHVFCGSKPATFGEPSKNDETSLGCDVHHTTSWPRGPGSFRKVQRTFFHVSRFTLWFGRNGPENWRTNPLVRPTMNAPLTPQWSWELWEDQPLGQAYRHTTWKRSVRTVRMGVHLASTPLVSPSGSIWVMMFVGASIFFNAHIFWNTHMCSDEFPSAASSGKR